MPLRAKNALFPRTRDSRIRSLIVWLPLGFILGSGVLLAVFMAILRQEALDAGSRLANAFAQITANDSSHSDHAVWAAALHDDDLDARAQAVRLIGAPAMPLMFRQERGNVRWLTACDTT
jgi:hypothetical protein